MKSLHNIILCFALFLTATLQAQVVVINGTDTLTASLPKLNNNFGWLNTHTLKFQGGWSSSVNYSQNDMVTYVGGTYISTMSNNLNNIPSVTGWIQLPGGSGGGSGGSDTWGLIGGSISAQTDLIALLNAKQATITGAPSTFPTLATVATTGAYGDLTGKPSLATVALSGSYLDLTNLPTFNGSYSSLTGKPSLFSGSYLDLTNKPSFAAVALSGAYSDLTGKPTFDGTYGSLTGKPSISAVGLSGLYSDILSPPTIPTASSTNPTMNGSAAPGTGTTFSRFDHVHPSDTSKISASLIGASSGVAPLDSSAKVPTGNLPTLPYANCSGDLTGSTPGCRVNGIDGVPLCAGYSPVNGDTLKYVTSLSPNPCYVAGPTAGSNSNCSTMTNVTLTAGQSCTLAHNLGVSSPFVVTTNAYDSTGAAVAIGITGQGTNSFTFIPSSSGTYSFIACGVGTSFTTGSASCASTPLITTSSLPQATVGQSGYTTTLAASGGTSPYTFSVTGGVLPVSLALTGSTGVITGNVSGSTEAVTFKVTDSASLQSSRTLTLTVNATPAITQCGSVAVSGSSVTCPSGTISTSYSQAINTSGGTGTDTCSVISGTLPTGITLTGTGTCTLSGTPTASGTSTFTIGIADANSVSGTNISFTLVVNPSGGAVQFENAVQFTASGSTPLTATITVGSHAGEWLGVWTETLAGSGANVTGVSLSGCGTGTFSGGTSVVPPSTTSTLAFWFLYNPPSGTCTINVALSSGTTTHAAAALYYNVLSSSPITTVTQTATGIGGPCPGTNFTPTITTVDANSWIVGGIGTQDALPATAIVGTARTSADTPTIIDSNGPLSAGSNTVWSTICGNGLLSWSGILVELAHN